MILFFLVWLSVSNISETCSLARVFYPLQWMMDYAGCTDPCQRPKSIFSSSWIRGTLIKFCLYSIDTHSVATQHRQQDQLTILKKQSLFPLDRFQLANRSNQKYFVFSWQISRFLFFHLLLGGAHFSSSSGISGLLLSGLFRLRYLPYSKKNPFRWIPIRAAAYIDPITNARWNPAGRTYFSLLISSARTGRRHEARNQLQEKRSDHSGVAEQEDLETKRGNEQKKRTMEQQERWGVATEVVQSILFQYTKHVRKKS